MAGCSNALHKILNIHKDATEEFVIESLSGNKGTIIGMAEYNWEAET